MRLLRIDTNKGNKVDGGFLHTVFETTRMNGERKINILASTKFDGVLCHPEHIEQFKNNPDEFLRSVSNDESDLQLSSDSNDGGDAA